MKKKKLFPAVLAIIAIFLVFDFCLSSDPVDDALDKYEEFIEETDRITEAVSNGKMTWAEFEQEYQEFLAKFDTEEMDVLDDIDNFSSSQLKRYLELEEKFKKVEEKYSYQR